MPAPPTSVTFRQANLDDTDALHTMIQVAYTSDTHWTNQSALVKGERITIDNLRAHIRTPTAPFLVAKIDDRVVGCVQITCTYHVDRCEGALILTLNGADIRLDTSSHRLSRPPRS